VQFFSTVIEPSPILFTFEKEQNQFFDIISKKRLENIKTYITKKKINTKNKVSINMFAHFEQLFDENKITTDFIATELNKIYRIQEILLKTKGIFTENEYLNLVSFYTSSRNIEFNLDVFDKIQYARQIKKEYSYLNKIN
jgi:hypothetical protein